VARQTAQSGLLANYFLCTLATSLNVLFGFLKFVDALRARWVKFHVCVSSLPRGPVPVAPVRGPLHRVRECPSVCVGVKLYPTNLTTLRKSYSGIEIDYIDW
jgi:hypothetical protein